MNSINDNQDFLPNDPNQTVINKRKLRKQKTILRVKDIALIAMFSSLIAICSWISIPMAVPFTLQTFAIFFALLVLGGFKGTLSILVYILLGLVGAPVFANFNAGIAYLLGPTGGYIVGFLFSGLTYWLLEKPLAKQNNYLSFLTLFISLLVCYLFGTIWFGCVYFYKGNNIDIWKILTLCVIPFIIPDVAKILIAILIKSKLKKMYILID